ncbi:acyl-CoA dehydrogenase family protein [Micromonospora sp. NPDC005171]|uniref:acyl-CoA dehydrogenase family protein n=1 Tax=Micromonospora sp. NPDC005171 TaxID=3156866 RepID=UPI0033B3ECC2
MSITDAPPRADLVRAAAELVPLLARHAQWSEDNRRLHDEVVEALSDAGILRMRVPERFGGYESDTRTVVEVIAELARGDGSAAWTVAVWHISSWITGLFPDSVRKEVFADPSVRISGILSPTAVAVPTEGGYLLNGKWSFNTGATQSQWNANAAVRPTPDGGYEPIMTLIPMADLQIIDDWHTSGLRGSGSVSTVADGVFLPEERVMSMVPIIMGQHPLQLDPNATMWGGPFMPVACATVGATALGLARAAKEAFFERLPGRKITYTDYPDQSQAPLTHLQVAEAEIKIDQAEFHEYRAADRVDRKGKSGEEWTLEERAKARLDLGAACQAAKDAVDVLRTASGGSSVYQHVPIQRIQRDVQTLNLHAIMHPNTNLELYGRILCGMGPNTQYL